MQKRILWQKVEQALLRNVATGLWPLGTYIPSEIELTKEFSVSRDTMRKALGSLVKQGIFERTPHIGTKVIGSTDKSSFAMELGSIRSIDEFGNMYPRRIHDCQFVNLNEKTAARLKEKPGTLKFCFCNVRTDPTRQDEVIIATYVYVNPEDASIYDAAKERPFELIVTLLEKKNKEFCAEVRQTFLASTMDEDVAEKFRLPVGSPCLVIIRNYLNSQRKSMAASISYHPAESYSISFSARKKSK